MRIGYAKGISMLKGDDANKEFSEKYKDDRIFADKHGECTARREMINYLREGDDVIVEDIYDICDSIGDLIDLLVQLHVKGVHFCCKKYKIHIEDFDKYDDLTKSGEITVAEACKKINIAPATFYRLRRLRENPGKK